jgi:protein-S-isoprenylcysteine O-methyltransferase Ste14
VIWVAVQVVLVAATGLAPLVERGGWPGAVVGAGAVAAAGGALLGLWSARTMGESLSPMPTPRPGAGLVDRGPYGVVRHPIYTAVIMVAVGWSLAMSSWLAAAGAALLASWLWAKSGHEERLLRASLEGYADYARRVPRRFLPFLL